MAKTGKGYIFATCFTSGIATILCLVALGTQQWVTSEGEFYNADFARSKISYGLFTGTFERTLEYSTSYEISITCLISNNICAYLCQSNYDDRVFELEKLYNDVDVQFNTRCPNVPKSYNLNKYWPINTNANRLPNAESKKREFINAGLYISTVVFLCIASLFGILSTGLGLWNTVGNPTGNYFNILGIYMYNGIACFASILTVSFWSALFGTRLVDNVCVLDTIIDVLKSEDFATLGYSFWILIPASLLYCTSMILLFIRQAMTSGEPEGKINPEETDHLRAGLMRPKANIYVRPTR